jgi:hypothetical protein
MKIIEFLKKYIPYVSNTEIKNMVKNGGVSINHIKIKDPYEEMDETKVQFFKYGSTFIWDLNPTELRKLQLITWEEKEELRKFRRQAYMNKILADKKKAEDEENHRLLALTIKFMSEELNLPPYRISDIIKVFRG